MITKKGFTLMELTIVLAILAIIAVILIPTFLNTTDRARLRSDIQSARAIQNAMDLYRAERNPISTWGANVTTELLRDLYRAGYFSVENPLPQTEGAAWGTNASGHVVVNISGSPENIRSINLPAAEDAFVIR